MHEPWNGLAPGWAVGDDVDTYSVNGGVRPWCPGLTLADIVAAEVTSAIACAVLDAAAAGPAWAPVAPMAPRATSVNGRFVPRASRPSTRIAPGDEVLLFEPIVGG